MRKLHQGSSPFGQPRFTTINFLAASDERHNHRPIVVPIHYLQHHFRFGNLGPFSSTVLLRIPSALGFVEDDNSLHRTFLIFAVVLVGKSVDIVNERSDTQFGVSSVDTHTFRFASRDISDQSLLDDSHERPVT
jgi:hypothetical protein